MFKFRDSLELYQMAHESDSLFAMLQDYTLDNRLSRTLMNNQILIRLGVLYPLYNDSEMMKFAIDNWFTEYDPMIKQLLDVKDGYDLRDPFNNINWTESYDGTRNDVNNDTNSLVALSDQSTNDTIENTISAYDSDEYQPQSKAEENETIHNERSEGRTDAFTGDRTEEHTLVHTGKDGTENYSKMLQDARDAAQFDIYDWIITRLEKAVCLGVY